MPNNTLTAAEAAFEKARQQLAEAEQRANQERQAEADRKAQALAEHDEGFLNKFDPAEEDRLVRQAEQHLRQTLAESPIVQAAAAVYAARIRRADRHSMAAAARSRLGQPSDHNVGPVADVDVVGVIRRVVLDVGEDIANAEREKTEAALQSKLGGN